MTTKRCFEELDEWYYRQCNEDWEHQFGVLISNTDNPGWVLSIDLTDTELEYVEFEEVKLYFELGDDYLFCNKIEKEGKPVFSGHCYVGRLNEMIGIFLDWAKNNETE